MKKITVLAIILACCIASTANAAAPARVKTWSSGEILSASDLNAEFNALIAALTDGTKTLTVSALVENGTTLASKYLGISAQAVDSAKLAGNTAATYGNSKATIEALLTGTITSHDHANTNTTFGTGRYTGALTLDSTLGVTGAAKFSSEVAVTGAVNKYVTNNTNDFKVTQAASGGSIAIGNGTNSTSAFYPLVTSTSTDATSGSPGYAVFAIPAADNANNPAFLFTAYKGGAVSASDLIQVKNYTTVAARINASGNMTLGATDLASTTSKLYVDGTEKIRGTSGGIGLELFLNSSTVGHEWYGLTFSGLSSAGTLSYYAFIKQRIVDNTVGSHSGALDFYTEENGIDRIGMTIDDSQEIYFPNLSTTTATAANVVLEGSPLQLKSVSSLRKLKTDIKPIGIDWSAFMKLNPVSFKQKSDPTGPTIFGFIAEEIEKVYKPLAVYADGKLQSVAYDRVGAVNTAAIQDHEKRIRELEAENAEMKSELAEIKRMLKGKK